MWLPPVMLVSTSTPFLASACMLSNTTADDAGAFEDQIERPELLCGIA